MTLLFIPFVALFGGPCPADARMLRLPAQLQHLSKEPAVISQHLDGQTLSDPQWEMSHINVVFHGVLGCLGLGVSVLLLSCLYDVARQWRHRSHFLTCKKKLQRLHEVLERSSGELPLCPCCAEFVSCKASRSAVVFLCGHRFHVECANRWMREQGALTGPGDDACPLCQSCSTNVSGPGEEAIQADVQESDGTALGQPDEFKSFVLRSLSKEYPDIIQEQCVRRWCNCHTELWLSELSYPQYSSIYHTKHVT